MAFCKFSSKFSDDSSIVIDNAFITSYLPSADSDFVKVYLWGLSLCTFGKDTDNNLESISKTLGLSEDRVLESFNFWQEAGLVQIVSKTPIEVRYLPIKDNSGYMKKYKPEKYTDFNKMVEDILDGRTITPFEFSEYYHFLECNNFEQEAFLCLVKYCSMLKGNKVGYPYILAVAKSFAEDGLKSEKSVSEKLAELELSSGELKSILKALGLKRDADPEERKMYLKWTKSFGFEKNVILYVAKIVKGGGVAKLDSTLVKFFGLRLFTIEDIETFTENQDQLFSLAREVTRTIGVVYQNLDNVVQTYISEWSHSGYDKETILTIANYCFKRSIRTLEGMDTIVQKFFKLGLLNVNSIEQHIGDLVSTDKKIQNILDKCGILRSVNSWDRDYFNTWTNSWAIAETIIMYAADFAKGKTQPLTYLNKILSSIHQQNITTLEETKKFIANYNLNTQNAQDNIIKHSYSEKELDALFDNLDDIDI